NIIAEQVVIEGTMRAFSNESYEIMTQRVDTLAKEIAKGYGCQAEVLFRHMYHVVDNDPVMVDALKKVAGTAYVETQPYLLAEDFSMYQQKVPSLFFFTGIRKEEKGYTHPLHSV